MKKVLISCIAIVMMSCGNSYNDTQITPITTMFDVKALRSEFIEDIEKPLTATFVESVSNLNTKIIDFTTSPSETTLSVLKNSWKDTAKAFSAIEAINIGAVKESYFLASFYTWGANENNITSYIASSDPITKEAISSKSTTMRGLAAIEFLIFENPSAETVTAFLNSERRTNYLLVLGENLVEKITAYNTAWANYRTEFINNSQSGIKGSVNMMVNEMNVVLENVRRFKVGEPAGLEVTNSPDASLLQAEKSGYSLPLIKENIQSIKHIYFDTENSLDNYVAFITKSEAINEKLKSQFETIEDDINTLSDGTIKDDIISRPTEVKKLYDDIRALLATIKTDVASALSVTITFTDNDGD